MKEVGGREGGREKGKIGAIKLTKLFFSETFSNFSIVHHQS